MKSACYKYDVLGHIWKQTGNLPEPRTKMGYSLGYGSGLVMAGGLGMRTGIKA